VLPSNRAEHKESTMSSVSDESSDARKRMPGVGAAEHEGRPAGDQVSLITLPAGRRAERR
jgi:hypothetical protein